VNLGDVADTHRRSIASRKVPAVAALITVGMPLSLLPLTRKFDTLVWYLSGLLLS